MKGIKANLAAVLAVAAVSTLAQAAVVSTGAGRPTWGAGIETTGPYYVNSWAVVQSIAHGTGSYTYPQWHELEFTNTDGATPVYTWDKAQVPTVTDLPSFSLKIYNTASSGSYGPHAGSFSVHFLPDDSYNTSLAVFKGTSTVGYQALGTVLGDYTTLGISASDPGLEIARRSGPTS